MEVDRKKRLDCTGERFEPRLRRMHHKQNAIRLDYGIKPYHLLPNRERIPLVGQQLVFEACIPIGGLLQCRSSGRLVGRVLSNRLLLKKERGQ